MVAIQSRPNDDFLSARFDNLVEIDTPQGKVWIEKHIDPAKLLGKKTTTPYSLAWAHLVAGKLLTPRERLSPSDPINGKPHTLKEALLALEIDPPTFAQWRKNHEDFGNIIDAALQEQAQFLQDEALMTARETTHPNQVAVASLQIDTLMKQAKQANQQRFGEKQKIEHSGEIAHTIVVETGIRRGQKIPEGFEDAIRDATPKSDKRQIIERDESGHAIEGVARYSDGDAGAEIAAKENSEEARAAQVDQSPGDQRERQSASLQSQQFRDPRPLLDLAAESENQEPVAIPDLTDKPF